MKISYLDQISNYVNDKNIIEFIIKLDDDNIKKILNLLSELKKNKISFSEEIIKKYIYNIDDNIFNIILNKKIDQNRTINDKINMIDKYLNNKEIYLFLVDDILLEKSWSDQLKVINIYVKKFDNDAYSFFLKTKEVLVYKTVDELEQIIDLYKKQKNKKIVKNKELYDNMIDEIFIEQANLINTYLTFKQIKKLINTIYFSNFILKGKKQNLSFVYKNLIKIIVNDKLLQYRNFNQYLSFIKEYVKFASNNNSGYMGYLEIILNKTLLSNFSNTFQNKLIEYYKKTNDTTIIDILKKISYILRFRKEEEIEKMLEKYMNSTNKEFNALILFSNLIISKRSYEQQQELYQAYLYSGCKKEIVRLIVDEELIWGRTNKQQLELIKLYLKYGMDENVYMLIINPNMIHLRSFVEQIELIKIYFYIRRNSLRSEILQSKLPSKELIENINKEYGIEKTNANITEISKELENLKEIVQLLKLNNIEEVNDDLKVYRYAKR